MSPSLAIFILLGGHLFSSSASFLKTITPAYEKLSTIKSLAASPLGSPSTSLSTTALTSLTGYLAAVYYSVSSCKVPLQVTFTALNTCFPSSGGLYTSIIADSETLTTIDYTDSLCTIVVKEEDRSWDFDCTNGAKTFITATSTFTPDIAMVNGR
jgi:hypothetical protein